ncbi:MAG TPA: hypothetical protein VIQ97_00450 [Prevotella sp.]
MIYLIIGLVALAVITGLIELLSKHRNNGEDNVIITGNSCATCTGENEQCEQECMMEASLKDIEYYNDEELDAFIGRAGNAYTDAEVEQFAEVLYTMRPDEAAGWNRSLILRGINLPDQLKDEVIMMIDNK